MRVSSSVWRPVLLVMLAISFLVHGCAAPAPQMVEVTREVVKQVLVTPTSAPAAQARYVFIFIGDGMATAQRNAAEQFLAKQQGAKRAEEVKLVMNTLPAQGMNTTYDLSSVIPDSASTATAILSGNKTKSGVVGMDAEGKVKYKTIAELAKAKGWKVGVVSTVSLDHATPAAFFAHVPSRNSMYDINAQMVDSGFDYFAGGQLKQHTVEGKPGIYDLAKNKGFTITRNRADFAKLTAKSLPILAMSERVDSDAAMLYALDRDSNDITLTEFVAKGIEVLDNPTGFLFGIEAGKVDWACHANDAAASIVDTLEMDGALAEAMKFYAKHPLETLIVVTGDHETGGMTMGFAGTQYSAFVDKIAQQKMSYLGFGAKLEEYKKKTAAADAKFEDLQPLIKEAFGLYVLPEADKAALVKSVADGKAKDASAEAKKAGAAAEQSLNYSLALTDMEVSVLKEAFKVSMMAGKDRPTDPHTYLLYGGYEPLAVKLTTILNNKAGIAWTSYSHTGVPVQTSAIGVGSEQFNGYYDQTDIFKYMAKSTGLAQ